MKRVVVYILLTLAFCLSACEDETPKNEVQKPSVSNTKLVVMETPFFSSRSQHVTLKIPKDWTFRILDHWERTGYFLIGPSGYKMQLVPLMEGPRDLENENTDDVLFVRQRVYEDTLDGVPRRLNISLVRVLLKGKNKAAPKHPFYYELVYDPTKSDSAVCEQVVKSIAVVDSIPENTQKPEFIFSWRNGLKIPRLSDFLCEGCSLQDSVESRNDSVQYFECSFDSVTYRLISDSNTVEDTLSAVYIKKGLDESLPRCKNGLRTGNWMDVGYSRDRMYKAEFDFRNKDHWIHNKTDTLLGDWFNENSDSLTLRYEHADVYFVNDTVDHLYYSNYQKKVLKKKVSRKRKKAL